MYERPVEVNAPWPGQRLGAFLRRQVETGRPDLPLLSVSAQRGVTRRVSDWGDGLRAASSDLSGYLVARPGDIVVNKLAAIDGALGRSSYLGLVSPAYYVLRAIPGVDTRFVDYLLHAAPYLSEIGRRSKWMPPAQFDISWELLRSMTIHLPNYETQVRIADYLDRETQRIDELIQTNEQLLVLLDERFVAWRAAALCRVEDDAPSHFFRSSGVPWLPKIPNRQGWAVTRLKAACVLQRGHDLPTEAREDGPYPIVSSAGKIGTHRDFRAAGPGVVTGRYGTVGEVYFVDGPFWPLNTALYVIDFRGNKPRYVYHLLSAVPLGAESDKSAVGGINRNVIHQLPIVLAPIDDQTAIAARIDSEREQSAGTVAALERQNGLLRERRHALITAAVTGELEVGEAV